jgi:carbonic anhydrase
MLLMSRYPLEAHFVHYNHKKYDDLSSAVGKENGLAVLGVFYEVNYVSYSDKNKS